MEFSNQLGRPPIERTFDELSFDLHDADIWLDRVHVGSDRTLHLAGLMYGTYAPPGRRRRLSARYGFVLSVPSVEQLTVEDPAKIEQVVVNDIVHDPESGVLLIKSAIPGGISARTLARTATLAVDDAPSKVRRLFRWRDLQPERQ
jgi:hypothetical protein